MKGLGPSLRVVDWNIERGLQLDEIKLAFTDKQAFLSKVKFPPGNMNNEDDEAPATPRRLDAQIDVLQSADVIVLNEVDWGMKRTDYKAVVKELGDALNMNWAYGVEFVEVDPKMLGLQSFADVKDEAKRKNWKNCSASTRAASWGCMVRPFYRGAPISEGKSRALQVSSLWTGTTAKRATELPSPRSAKGPVWYSEKRFCAKCDAEVART